MTGAGQSPHLDRPIVDAERPGGRAHAREVVKQSLPDQSDTAASGTNRDETGGSAKNQWQDNDPCQVGNRFFHKLGSVGTTQDRSAGRYTRPAPSAGDAGGDARARQLQQVFRLAIA